MSEQTGASPEQIEAAVERAYATWGYGEGMPHVLGPEVRQAARFLVPPGMKIVPADAVCITPEIAATAAEALPRVIAFLCGYGHSRPQLAADIIAITDLATSFEAAAAALRGEG